MGVKTHTGSSLYFIALIPEAETEQELYDFKLELFKKYQCKAALKSPAHITLIPPFPWANFQQETLLEIFRSFRTDISSFEISIEGFDTFGTQVVYAKPLYHPFLFELQTSIQSFFEPFLKDKIKNRYQFHPHITIANRDLKSKDVPEIIEQFSLKNYHTSTQLKEISLLKHNGVKWEIAAVIAL